MYINSRRLVITDIIELHIYKIKDQEIHDLKSKMDEMAEEFGEMLRVRCIFEHISEIIYRTIFLFYFFIGLFTCFFLLIFI